MKSDLVRMARLRNLALRDGRDDEGRRHHLSALEAELENVGMLARYVRTLSPAAGHELETRQSMVSQHFQQLKGGEDVPAINRWVTQELAPLLNKSEQAAHLVATSVRTNPRNATSPFAWPVYVQLAVDRAASHSDRARSGGT